MLRRVPYLFSIALLLLGGGCQQPRAPFLFRGGAMGTSYSIKVSLPEGADPNVVRRVVQQELTRFDTVFSTYVEESEISRFNRHASEEPFAATEEFGTLVRHALELAEKTDGAFDPTIGPLLRLYGFGPGARTPEQEPDAAAIAAVQQRTGWQRLKVRTDGTLQKTHPDLELDLNALAKGTGVDRVSAVLDDLGCRSYMVEIGGEVRCRGIKPDGTRWTLGIADPRRPGQPEFIDKVELVDRAMATSGSYVQYREFDGSPVHHILAPRTGRNPEGEVVSVTVIADTCELADGLATALMVLGPDGAGRVLRRFPFWRATPTAGIATRR